ncbi:hypothetical protein V6N13_055825 [Hibiscus sabdariffa]
MASSSSCSSPPMKYHVFLSFRGEQTRLNFTSHLLEALEETGLSVFFDEKKLKRGERISPALSRAIEASRLSIIVLSSDYASSKSCLAELSHIMDHKDSHGHIVLPIFFHVNPGDVRNFDRSFKASFDDHESNRPVDEVERWKAALAKVGELKGWHIKGCTFDRSETQYIKDIVACVIEKLMNSNSKYSCGELVGIDGQRKAILGLIEQKEIRVIGLLGMGGIGKTTLADAVYKEASTKFEGSYFLDKIREKIEKQGVESLRNQLLSALLKEKDIRIDTPSIGPLYQERLNNKKVIVVLDDVIEPDLIDYMGAKYFGDGSKIIVTSRDRQVLINGGAVKIHKVKKLNRNDSLQLFHNFVFKQLHPAAGFLPLSWKFVDYAGGNPLALKILAGKLHTKNRGVWESEVNRLKQYSDPQISHKLKNSFDVLSELEQNIFLDIACFFSGEHKSKILTILSSLYAGAISGIISLVDKCLLDINSYGFISIHDLLKEMGKDIVCRESRRPGKRTRLWNSNDVYQVLKYNKATELVEGLQLDMSQIDKLQLSPSVFEKMYNLKYIHFYIPPHLLNGGEQKLLAKGVDIVSLSNELRYLSWVYYPFKSLSSSFNGRNLVVLKLNYGSMKRLWNEDDHQDLVNLMEIDVSFCKNLRKIPNLLGAINLKTLDCSGCNSLVELPCLDHLASLENLQLSGCRKLRKIPTLLGAINLKTLDCSRCESLVELPCLSHLTSLKDLDLEDCYKLKKFPELPNNFSSLDLSDTEIEEVPDSIERLVGLKSLNLSGSKVKNISRNISKLESLQKLEVASCQDLKSLPELPLYLWFLEAENCTSLEKVWFTKHNSCRSSSYHDDEDKRVLLSFSNCFGLVEDSVKNIESNAMFQIQSLSHRLVSDLVCCFPGNEISANEFEHQSVNSSLNLKIAPNESRQSRLLTFAICLVPDFSDHGDSYDLKVNCNYQLTEASGKEFRSECVFSDIGAIYDDDHVFILSGEDLIVPDNDYEESLFDFSIKHCLGENEVKDIKVKKCGVRVFYMDGESYAESDVESGEKSDRDEMSNDDTQKKVHDDSATKMRPAGSKRSFSYDGGERDRVPKRWK